MRVAPLSPAWSIQRAGAAQARRRIEADLQAASVRVGAHERLHAQIAGRYADSAPRYIHVSGPDGRLYAVGGSLKVDLRPVPGDPVETLRKAHAIMRAAIGPGDPSAADMRIAAAAYRLAAGARRDMETASPGSRVSLLA
jgi:hypothetical protein